MSQAQFRKMIDDFCLLCGLAEPQHILDGGPVAIGDVVFSLICHDQVKPARIVVYCEFGDVPKGREADAYRILLEANMYLYDGTGPIFLISNETGRVVLAEYHLLDGLEPTALRDAMIAMSEHAKAWRFDHFLDKSRTHRLRPEAAALRTHGGQRGYLKERPKD